MDFAAVEARILAMALNHGIEVECIPEEDLHSHDDIQAVLVNEQLAKHHDEQVVISMGGRQMSRSYTAQLMHNLGALECERQPA
tara:strand:+ start:3636 stop:3887 length:252 start_codon:yes stop_codon:yes gene_type:complete